MSSKREKANAKESGTNSYKKILTFKRKLMATTFSCRDKESNSSRLSIKTRESWWSATNEWLGCSKTMTKSKLLSSWLNKWESAMKRNKPFFTMHRILELNFKISSSNTTRSKENWRTSCVSDRQLTLKSTPQTPDLPMASNKILKDWFKE